MIKINIKKSDDLITSVTVYGHAMYDEYGKDIVCSAVSSIVITTINGLLKLDNNSINYTENEGYIKIDSIKKSVTNNILINNMIDLLKELKEQYPKNIKINEEV